MFTSVNWHISNEGELQRVQLDSVIKIKGKWNSFPANFSCRIFVPILVKINENFYGNEK